MKIGALSEDKLANDIIQWWNPKGNEKAPLLYIDELTSNGHEPPAPDDREGDEQK